MNIAAITNNASTGLSQIGRGHSNAPAFAESLIAASRRDEQDKAAQEQATRDAAQQLVATAFLTPLFQQMRQSPFKSEIFHGGFAEDAFGAQLDTELADRIARRTNFPLVDAIQRQMTKVGRQVNTHA